MYRSGSAPVICDDAAKQREDGGGRERADGHLLRWQDLTEPNLTGAALFTSRGRAASKALARPTTASPSAGSETWSRAPSINVQNCWVSIVAQHVTWV